MDAILFHVLVVFPIILFFIWLFTIPYRHKISFYVLYNDGEKSILMSKTMAKDYAKMFGGKVIEANHPMNNDVKTNEKG